MSSKVTSAIIVTMMALVVFVGGYLMGYSDGIADALSEFRKEINTAQKLPRRN